ncbi:MULTISPECIES: DNA-directed RNA polymerase subunit alpha C-terminal domain-containing protein [Sporosarcina]|uniref:DNA-directed RNA polymerase subunit alpha C-terminal domain-containing protein n=1 Tax=Sporosarcina TaxID=1569 RepID=UPI00078B76CD|nr:hypothetical protein AZE41_10785 [Sporosarcina psychrophila]QNK86092.1 hypothetical protein H7992_12365 [Sporosarcina sp. resist]
MKEPIEILELSVRLTKILKKNDIHTLEDLITEDTFELECTGPIFRKELEEVIDEIILEVQ